MATYPTMTDEYRNGPPSRLPADVSLPVLMYHEIVSEPLIKSSLFKMTSSYYLSAYAFEEQMKSLFEQGYRSIGFDEVDRLDPDGRYVIITFDDGLIGNAKYALPILKKYGFKAIFYVVAGAIDSPRYMSWIDLKELIASGMSIQSHTMSHRSLLTLSEQEIEWELNESKDCLERRLQVPVTSLSFPHGHHNQMTIRMAYRCGYRVLCTSEVICNNAASFRNTPVVLGRINVNGGMSTKTFIKLVGYDTRAILMEIFAKGSKNLVKRVIGINNYGKIYSWLFNIKSRQ